MSNPVASAGGLLLALGGLVLLATACRAVESRPPELVGRWQVMSNQGLSVPETLFLFSMDLVEFREDGTLVSLVYWPPDTETEIRRNKTVTYARIGDNDVAISGDCRAVGPCTGTYTLKRKGDELQLSGEGGELVLGWVGPAGAELPPEIMGPSPSPTPPGD